MNCAQCGNRVKALTEGMHLDESGQDWMFCNRDCLRVWLGPDRPLTRRVEQAQKADEAPLYIVADGQKYVAHNGETAYEFHKRLVRQGVLIGV